MHYLQRERFTQICRLKGKSQWRWTPWRWKASKLLKEGLGGDWLSSGAWMGKSGLDKNLWGKKAWGSAHENQTLREFTLCDPGFLPAETKERRLNSTFTETVGGSGCVLKRITKKSLLRKIKGLTGCPEGLLEVRHLNFVMVAWFFTITWGFRSTIHIFWNRSFGSSECSPNENLQGGQR